MRDDASEKVIHREIKIAGPRWAERRWGPLLHLEFYMGPAREDPIETDRQEPS